MASEPGQVALAVDVGGTKMYGAAVAADGTLLHERQVATVVPEAIEQLRHLIDELHLRTDRQSVAGVGIGVPGILSAANDRVVDAPALHWLDVPLLAALQPRCAFPVRLENDVNLAALGEYGFGAGQGAGSLICIAVGTGVGAGIVINGRVYSGAHQMAGEVGYTLPSLAALEQPVGGFGAFERIASGSGLTERAQAHQPGVTAVEVVTAARSGVGWAQTLLTETGDYLAWLVANIGVTLDPEVVIFSGGVMQAGDLLLPYIEARVRRVIPFAPRLTVSTLGAKAAVLGAAQLVFSGAGR